jgi:Chlorophyll A-B binding protein
MKLAVLASLAASAAAFAPAQQGKTSTALNMAFEDDFGAVAPLGFFDPLGLVADGDQAKFDRLRYVEIKHGRICMLGVVGYLITAAGIRLPGDIALDGTKFADIPAGWAGSTAVPVAGALQVRSASRIPSHVHLEHVRRRNTHAPFPVHRSSPSSACSRSAS